MLMVWTKAHGLEGKVFVGSRFLWNGNRRR